MDAQKMLINALHPEDMRIAIVQGKELVELQSDSINANKKLKGNIYKTRITRIEPSLQAAFIDIGTKRNAFLQINDVHPSYFLDESYQKKRHQKIPIQRVLKTGQEIIVQVVKEERGVKGATLTTYLSLPGRYIVLMPGSDSSGMSKKIKSSSQRSRLNKIYSELELPTGMGMIIRTAGIDRSLTDLSRDLDIQLKLWEKIITNSKSKDMPALLYQESDSAIRVIRDYFTPEIREILIDDHNTYERVKNFVGETMPRYRSRVKHYANTQPIFTTHNIDSQVENTMKREVALKSGGSIVIDSLEALVAIDVNSGKSTSGDGIEETAYRTNLEAAREIARQLRLRDLGGLIVIDFIDMISLKNRTAVERELQEAVKIDKARIELGQLSKFGLLEMSRQRLRASIIGKSTITCQHCQGRGFIKSASVVALEVLRKIQSAIIVGGIRIVKCRLSPSPALFILNNKKSELVALEEQYGALIYILADNSLLPDSVEFEMESAPTPPKSAPVKQEIELAEQEEE